jgi:hypothetical protein
MKEESMEIEKAPYTLPDGSSIEVRNNVIMIICRSYLGLFNSGMCQSYLVHLLNLFHSFDFYCP